MWRFTVGVSCIVSSEPIFWSSHTFASDPPDASGTATAAFVHAGKVFEELSVGAPEAQGSANSVVTDRAVVAADAAGTLAGGSILVYSVDARERDAAFTAVRAR